MIAWRQETDRGKRVLAFDLKQRSQLPTQVKAFVRSQMRRISAVCHLPGSLVKAFGGTLETPAIEFLLLLGNVCSRQKILKEMIFFLILKIKHFYTPSSLCL